jgi:hypothetical protein
MDVYKTNFDNLFGLVEKNHPDAIKAKPKLFKKEYEKKILIIWVLYQNESYAPCTSRG